MKNKILYTLPLALLISCGKNTNSNTDSVNEIHNVAEQNPESIMKISPEQIEKLNNFADHVLTNDFPLASFPILAKGYYSSLRQDGLTHSEASNAITSIFKNNIKNQVQAFKALSIVQSKTPLATKEEAPDFSLFLKHINREYQNQRILDQEVNNNISFAGYGAQALAAGASIALSFTGVGLPVTLGVGMFNLALDASFDTISQNIEEEMKASSLNYVAQKLQQATPSFINALENLHNEEPSIAQLKASKMMRQWSRELAQNIDDESEKELLETMLGSSISQMTLSYLAREGSLQKLTEEKQDKEIAQIKQELVALAQTFSQFNQSQEEQKKNLLMEIQNGQSEFQNFKEHLSTLIEHNIDIPQEIKNQIDAVMKGRSISSVELDDAQEKYPQISSLLSSLKNLNIQKKTLEIKIFNSLDAAGQMIQLASRLGVDHKIIDVSSNLLKGFKLFDSFKKAALETGVSGYLGAINLALDLFGQKQDIGAKRHQQIMETLGKLAQGQQKLLQGQSMILTGQKNIMLMQKETLATIIKIGEEIYQQNQTNYLAINEVKEEVLYNRKMMLANLESGLDDCASFITTQQQDIEEFGYSFQTLQNNFTKNDTYYQTCFNELRQRFEIHSQETSPVFHYQSQDNYRKSLNDNYQAILQYLSDNDNNAFAQIGIPSENIMQLDTKVKKMDKAQLTKLDYNKAKYLLSAESLERNISYAMAIYPLESFRNNGELDFTHPKTFYGTYELRLLKNIREHLSIAIAQQSLLSGDALIPILYRDLKRIQTEKPNCLADASHPWCILKSSPLLTKNFMNYALNKQLSKNGYSTASYLFAKNFAGDDFYLKQIAGSYFKFAWHQGINEWTMELNGISTTIPSIEDFEKGKLIIHAELENLLKTFAQVQNSIHDFEIKGDNKKRATIYRLMLHSVI